MTRPSFNTIFFSCLVLVLSLTTFAIVGFSIAPLQGEFISVGIWLALVALILLLGDKIILSFLEAKTTPNESLTLGVIDNFSTLLSLNKIDLYYSRQHPNNIYFADSLFSTPSIIIGENISNLLTNSEINTAILSILIKMKSGRAKLLTTFSLIISTFYIPLLIFNIKGLRSKLYFFKKVFVFYVYPIHLLENLLFSRKFKFIIPNNKNLILLKKQNCDYASALFKIYQVEKNYAANSFVENVIKNLSITDNSRNDILSEHFDSKTFSKEQYLKIVSRNFSE